MNGLTVSMAIALFSSFANAEIPREYYKYGDCQRQQVVAQDTDGVVQVADAVRCDTLYSDVQFIELAIANREHHKEIYITDYAAKYDSDRSVTAKHVSSKTDFERNNGATLYLGKRDVRTDLFLVRLVSDFRPKPAAPLDVYVKMGGRQYETRNVRFGH